jgi:hypothetical protein
MIGPINHEVISADGLNKHFYQYWFNDRDLKLVLDHYRHEYKPTKRHQWRKLQAWDRQGGSSQWASRNQIERDAIPNLDTVRAEVLKKFIEQITID